MLPAADRGGLADPQACGENIEGRATDGGGLRGAGDSNEYSGVDKKSTSSTGAMLGTHCLESLVTTHQIVALSSREAGFYGMVKAASPGLDLRQLLTYCGINVELEFMVDATAGKGNASTRDRTRAALAELGDEEDARDREGTQRRHIRQGHRARYNIAEAKPREEAR